MEDNKPYYMTIYEIGTLATDDVHYVYLTDGEYKTTMCLYFKGWNLIPNFYDIIKKTSIGDGFWVCKEIKDPNDESKRSMGLELRNKIKRDNIIYVERASIEMMREYKIDSIIK